MCYTGFQDTPVASIATCVQPACGFRRKPITEIDFTGMRNRPRSATPDSSSWLAVVVANSRCPVVAFRAAAMGIHAFTHRDRASSRAHRR